VLAGAGGINKINKVMRPVFISILLLSFFSIAAQKKKELYYSYDWKPCAPEIARFYSTVEKTDSGWLRNDYFIGTMSLQMRALYEDSACKSQNGNCIYFHANGSVSSVGRRVHNKREGVCLGFYSNKMMSDSANYHNDIPTGNKYAWHRNGYLSDSSVYINDSLMVAVSWSDKGVPFSAGYLLHGKMHGKWKFFHPNGEVSGVVNYANGNILTEEYFNEDGSAQTNASKANSPTSFKKGGKEGWLRYVEKSLYWPTGYQFVTGTMAVVVVDFTINEEGKPVDVEITIPFHPEFDRIALNTIRNSPAWLSAVAFNRKVKARFRQPVTFQQQE
jgi:TonB family protein